MTINKEYLTASRGDKGEYNDGITVISKNGLVRVDWTNLGEGLCGDYDPKNTKDVNLLRFDVYFLKDGEWVDPEDASYCTLMPATMADDVLIKAARHIANTLEDHTEDNCHKKICERMSWIDPRDFPVLSTEEMQVG